MLKRSKVASIAIAATMSVTLLVSTQVSAYCLIGDVNNDGAIDACDASWVLAYYADESTGKHHNNVSIQLKDVADVNHDGSIDACDASEILAFYAATSTGNSPMWSTDIIGIDALKLKNGYKWVVMEEPSYTSIITGMLDENSHITIIKAMEKNWYYIEWNSRNIGFINVTEYERGEFFEGKTPVSTSVCSTTAMSTTTTAEQSTTELKSTTKTTTIATTMSRASTADKSTTKSKNTTMTTTVATTRSSTTTTNPVTSTIPEGCIAVMQLKDNFSWTLYKTSSWEVNEVLCEVYDDDVIFVMDVDEDKMWYHVIVNDIEGYLLVFREDLKNCFKCD